MRTLIILGAIAAALFTRTTLAQEISLHPEAAVLTGPFVLTNGYVYQAAKASSNQDARALFNFSVTNSGSYAILATVNAGSSRANLFAINIDAEPKEPEMIWDIATTSGFEPQIVSWRGNGTASNPQHRQQSFRLSAGAHQLIIRGLDADAQLKSVSILPLPPAPTGLHVVAGPS